MTAVVVSPAQAFVERLVPLGHDRAHELLDKLLEQLTTVELAALAYDWANVWARPNQLPPPGPWRSWGFLTARRFGKTRSVAEWINGEAISGRAMRIGFCAQNADKAIEVMVEGEAGLIATAPPWAKPIYTSDRVLWPNGAQAFPFTPEVPGAIRGPGVHLFWASELQSWPASKREEAWYNAQLMTSLGYARTVWDATPKRRHPLLRRLLQNAEADPEHHHVVRGVIEENADNLAAGVIGELRRALAGTQREREELDGGYDDDDDDALWSQVWIDRARRSLPTELVRRILVIDPAITSEPGSDQTGMIDLGLGVDGQAYVCGDLTSKQAWEAWGRKACLRYVRHSMDCVVLERNRGGDAPLANVRANARALGLRVRKVEPDATTRHVPGVIYAKEVHARGSKGVRAEPVAVAYKRGRVSHVKGVNLEDLEERMATWIPEAKGRSPDGIDALVHGIWELLDLSVELVDVDEAFDGIEQLAKQLKETEDPAAATVNIAALLGESEWGSRL